MKQGPQSNTRICIIGAGNIAWHLGHRLKEKGFQIVRLVNRSAHRGKELANLIGAEFTQSMQIPSGTCDLVILAVSDLVLSDVIDQLECENCIVVHTAGSMSIGLFKGKFCQYGVLYPFQSLTRGIPAEISKVPMCIEASDEATLIQLRSIACSISSLVHEMSSDERKKLHLGGIIMNNFINHLVAVAGDFLNKNKIDPELLKPLLAETIEKLHKSDAREAQTGPARRKDQNVIQAHLKLLENEPMLKNLYSTITDSIIAYYSKD